MSRREFTPSIRDGEAPRPRPATAPAPQRPKSAFATKNAAETTFELPAATGILRRPSSAFPTAAQPLSLSAAASASARPSSALSTGSAGAVSGNAKHKPLLPLHIDTNVFRSQKYAMNSPAEVYSGVPLVERDLETNLMVNFLLRGSVPEAPPPEMSLGFLEPKSQDSQGIQRKVAKCIRSASMLRARGEVELALAEYSRMLNMHPHDYDLLCSLGTMLCRVGETAMAVKALSKACECRPSSAVAYYNLGCAHMHHMQRQTSRAAQDLRAAPALRAFDMCIAIAPISEAFAARALCKRRAGDFLGATLDYNTSKTALSAHAVSKEVAPQQHRAWLQGAKLLASTIQVRKDAEKKLVKAKRQEAVSAAERKQRVLRDLFVDPLKKNAVAVNDASSADDDSADGSDEGGAKQKDVEWASDSSSSDEEGRAVAAVVEEDYLAQYTAVSSSTAASLDADVLLARSKSIRRLENSKPEVLSSLKQISRIRDVADSVATISDHETKINLTSGAAVAFSEAELPGTPSAQKPAVVFAPSDTVKRFKARQRWLICKQFMRVYGPVSIPVQRRTHRHTSRIVDMIKRFEFLNKLPPYILQQIAQCVRPRTFESGDLIIRQGSAGTSLFIIMLGNVDVLVHFGDPKQAVLSLAKRVAGFAVGQAFGETAFTSAAPRSAFCVAATSVVAAELLKEDFDRIKKAYDSTQTNLRIEALRPLLFLESDLDQTQLERMAKTMTPFAKPPGTTIFAQGDKCATMYYITQGQLSFFRKPSNGRIKATAIALQKQFDMEERTNALESAKHSMSADAASSPDAAFSDTRKYITAAERRNAFLEMSVLMDIDPHEDPTPSLTKARKIALGKKLLYAAQLGACDSLQDGAAGDSGNTNSNGAVVLEVMGKVDTLDGMLKDAAAANVDLPEGRLFEDRDQADKFIRLHGVPVLTLHAPCIINHEGVVCCGDRKGFSGASLFTAIAPVHCTGYQIIRSHFQTCGPNIENIVEANLAQRLKDMCVAVNKNIEWRRFKNSLLKQYHLKGVSAAANPKHTPE